ncbi:MAG: TonB-dependent receptor [Bacteroidales bacterium]|jgi:TonB-linked SusC/RagA family outer membrane protein|nr:TonB-dependent receptor [Bacteroidales bacterium]
MKKFLLLTLSVMMGVSALFAQQRITGTVTSAEDNAPLPYVTIVVGGTTISAQTDLDGVYSINVPAGSNSLTFSYVGMETVTVQIDNRSVVNVEMLPAAEMLQDIVVVGYGVTRKSSFVGSASVMSGEKLEKMQSSNISKSLEGALAGVQITSSSGTPGSGASIYVRGIGSISASQAPLIVVDGVPYEGSLNSIPSQDIESMTILKDAAANSIYGARGSNGVIVITTKQGRADRVRVSFEGRVGINDRAVPAYNIILDPGEFYEMAWESIRNQMYYSGSMDYMAAGYYTSNNLIDSYLKYNVYKGVDNQSLVDPLTGRLNPSASTKKWTDDWTKDVFRAGIRQEYSVSASGGSENTQAYASISYLNDEGYVEKSGFSRISVRAKVDQTIGKFIKVGMNVAYSNTEQDQFNTSVGSNYSNLFMFSQQIAPIYPIFLYDINTGERLYGEDGTVLYDWGNEYQRPYSSNSNAYGQMMTSKYTNTRDNVSSRAFVDVRILKDLKFTANVAYDVFNSRWVENYTNVGGDALSVGGRGYQTSSRNAALNINQLLNYNPTFGDHELNVLLGHETKNDQYNYLYGHMTNFVDNNNKDFANATMYQNLTSYSQGYALEGFFGRVEYNYGNKYYATASYRRDGSSRFAPENRWGDFWSVGASWRLDQEGFLRGSSVIDQLKLKASYGTQGNDNIGMTKVYQDLYSIARVDGEASLTKSFRGNRDVTWEKSTNFNVGLEAALFNRLNLNVDYFIKKTTDMIYNRPLAPSQGSPSSLLVNDIDMQNSGVEFELSADLVKTRDIRWNLSINGTHYKNQLTKLPSDKDPEGYQSGSYWRKIGGSLYDWYTYEWAGVDPTNGLPQYNKYTKDDDGNETVTIVNRTSEASLREIGKSALPDFYGGFSTSLHAYGFDLSAAFAFQIGGWVSDSHYQMLMTAGTVGQNWHTDIFNRWTPANTVTDIPRVEYQNQDMNQGSTRFLTSASYLSLRNLTLGYTLPKKVAEKVNIANLRIYLVGDNLWFKSARKGLDTRQSIGGGTGYIYSALRTYSVGLTIAF